jgi:hypothetical protein
MSRKLSTIPILLISALLLAACSSAGPTSVEPTNSPTETGLSPTNNEIQTPVEPTDESTSEPSSEEPTAEPTLVVEEEPDQEQDYQIITLLPPDAIPAIDNPTFLNPDEADDEYAPEELVLGVEFNGDARAYSISYLSGHEIVNDTVGGKKISVTW